MSIPFTNTNNQIIIDSKVMTCNHSSQVPQCSKELCLVEKVEGFQWLRCSFVDTGKNGGRWRIQSSR